MEEEAASERDFNEQIRRVHLITPDGIELHRSLAIPIDDGWQTKRIWCSMKLTMCLETLQLTIGQVWNLVISIIKPIGYIKSGHYTKVNSVPTSISTKIDLFEQVDLLDLKAVLQSETGVRCNMHMENFAFD